MVQREICNTRWYQNFALFECLAVDKLTKWGEKKVCRTNQPVFFIGIFADKSDMVSINPRFS